MRQDRAVAGTRAFNTRENWESWRACQTKADESRKLVHVTVFPEKDWFFLLSRRRRY
jgi:hypothetical protein